MGVDGEANSAGFFLLSQIPAGAPNLVPPGDVVMSPDSIRKMVAPSMQSVMKDYVEDDAEMQETIDWLVQSAVTGSMPYSVAEVPVESAVEDGQTKIDKRSQWGPLVKVGIASKPAKQGDFYLMTSDDSSTNAQQFWAVPEEVEKHSVLRADEKRKIVEEFLKKPAVKYTDQKSKSKSKSSSKSKRGQKRSFVHTTNQSSSSSTSQINQKLPKNVSNQKSMESDESDDASVDSTAWPKGVIIDDCVVGQMAVVHRSYENGATGIEIWCVLAKMQQDGEWYISGDVYGPPSTSDDSSCVTGKWNKKTNSPDKAEPVNCKSVIMYFPTLTGARQLPANVKKYVTEMHVKHEVFVRGKTKKKNKKK
jgi:hypothetical protein